MTRKICVFTGSRAEYGLLAPLMREIQSDGRLQLQIVVSGSHLEHEFGETWREIEADGFKIDSKVEMKIDSDRPVALARSMALCLAGCAEAFDGLKPDILVLLGDRYEALAAAEAALLLRLPIAHIHGGEITEGAIDDAIRHAITKMASLHFAATEEYRDRIIQMGEQPGRVFWVGAPGLDNIACHALLGREELEKQLGFLLGERNLLVTYHPATLSHVDPATSVRALLAALNRFPDAHVVITKSNADAGGREINCLFDEYAQANPNRVLAVASLGSRRYRSMMAVADVVVGNSSSGIIEAPAAGKPTVNIGIRQQGRVRAPSVIDCADDAASIAAAIARSLSSEIQEMAMRRVSPYGVSGASKKIKDVLGGEQFDRLAIKKFYTPAAMQSSSACSA